MKRPLLYTIGRGLGKFLTYRKFVEISSKLNFPFAPPLVSSMQITLRCNSRCVYCNIWKLKDNSEAMPLDTLGKIFGSLRELGVKIVSLTGGEPLMRNDLAEVIHLAKCYGLLPHVCTNGIALTKERAIELVKAGVHSIILSLDTLDSEIYEKQRGVSFKFAERALASLAYIANEYPQICVAVNCVISRHNIGKLVPFVLEISKRGEGKILINFQPYHQPSSFSLRLSQEIASELWACYKDMLPEDNLIPSNKSKSIFEKEIEELIQLKRDGFPLNNSEYYLRAISDFLFDNKLPRDFVCIAGYTGIFIRFDLKVSPCWRLPPIGDLREEELTDIWFSGRYKKIRKEMKSLRCPGCLLPCHNEPGWFELYNSLYKSSVLKFGGVLRA